MKRKLLIIFIWLLLWQGISLLVHNSVLLAGPWESLQALGKLALTGDFWLTMLRTLGRILLGILLGTGMGFLLAYAGHRKKLLGDFLSPVISLGKAIPVASFVILLLIWFGNEWVAFAVVVLVTFPIAYLNIQKGLQGMSRELTELTLVYRITGFRRFTYVELPQLRAQIAAAFSLAVGMGFKSGIAAEVIGQARLTIGNEMYRAKIYLETAELFAWTATVILLSWVVEKILFLVLKKAGFLRTPES